jgi:hypothetical protein
MQLVPIAAVLAIVSTALAQNAPVVPRMQRNFQIAPVPADPLEPVTGDTRIPGSPQERAALLALMEKAMENHNLHLRGGAPYHLQASFTAAPSTLNPGGAGVLEESWVSGQNWRWSGNVGGYSNVQMSSNGVVYGTNTVPMPIHFKILRHAVFAPLVTLPRQRTLRSATASIQGVQATCILLSAGWNEQTPAPGRQWYEAEYCINPASGAVQIWSPAPGIYVVYNYANAIAFHGRTLPGGIMVSESGATVIDAQVTSMTDANPGDLSLYTPTAQMAAQGPAIVANLIERFPLIFGESDIAPEAVVQPTIVHATIDQNGKVLEAEALQSSAMSARALAAVINTKFGQRPQPAGASPLLSEVFINVQFRPGGPMQAGR